MNMYDEYGATGEALYKSWERKFEEIRRKSKFDGADVETELGSLKTEVNDTINKYLQKAKGRKKFGIITIFVPFILLALGSFTLTESTAFLTLISILLPVYGFMSMRSCNKVLVAAMDFDKKYFDGEIIYRRKNG